MSYGFEAFPRKHGVGKLPQSDAEGAYERTRSDAVESDPEQRAMAVLRDVNESRGFSPTRPFAEARDLLMKIEDPVQRDAALSRFAHAQLETRHFWEVDNTIELIDDPKTRFDLLFDQFKHMKGVRVGSTASILEHAQEAAAEIADPKYADEAKGKLALIAWGVDLRIARELAADIKDPETHARTLRTLGLQTMNAGLGGGTAFLSEASEVAKQISDPIIREKLERDIDDIPNRVGRAKAIL